MSPIVVKYNEIYIIYNINELNATISTNDSYAKNNMSIANSLYLHVLLRICLYGYDDDY